MQSQIELIFQDIKDKPQAKIVKFIGDLDTTNVDYVVEKILGLMNSNINFIIADFEKLRYVNSTGLGIILHFSKTAKGKKGCFKITNVNEHVYEIIEIIGATTLLEIYDEVKDAIHSLQ